MANKKYKVCILAYSLQYKLARNALDLLDTSEVEYLLMNCSLENQDDCVQSALLSGCEVFVSGPGNTARFRNCYHYPIIEIRIRDIDYAMAVKSALNQGCSKIAITRHRYSNPVPKISIESLLNVEIQEIVFESSAELYELVKISDCDAIVGTSLAVDAADCAGKTGVLLYFGTDGICDACRRAAHIAREQYESRRNREIVKAIMNNSQVGIIVTDTNECVQFINYLAQEYTGLSSAQLRGKPLSEFFTNFSEHSFIKSSQKKRCSYHIVEGVMMRCVQDRITLKGETIGVLTTLRPDSHNRRKKGDKQNNINAHIYRWADLTDFSPAMKSLIDKCKTINTKYPTAIIGEPGSGREEIAYCLHGGSDRAKFPCITIDLATIPEQDAAKLLFGYDKGDMSVSGLLSDAANGSVVFKNIALASPKIRACIQHIVTVEKPIHSGPSSEIPDIAVFTVLTKEEYMSLPADLRSVISIIRVDMPALRERTEDIDKLFLQYVSRLTDLPRRLTLSHDMTELLQFYSWPGNVRELRSVATRFALERSSVERATAKTQYLMLMHSIGEEEILKDTLEKYPVLTQRPIEDTTAFLAAFERLKYFTKYSNDRLGELLGVSRTTLWRLLKDLKHV